MGVPKFYRWISERYPCLSEIVKEFELPEFDNLYLDMNGIIHTCSHPEDDNPHFRITEEQIFKDICHYIEFLFRMIKPRKVFFMAVDGVAPRAKMNQQRGRRFRSAREAEELIKKAEERGETLPAEKRFDSNCITPGTTFMVQLQEHLKYFVVDKITHDALWQGPQIYLSGHETPGEGEHKVMDFIRYSRSQPGYDSNTRHCLYGLDADLIMLGLTSHEPHFALLREEVKFGGRKDKNKRSTTPEETTFHLLHLSLLREYIDYEFSSLRPKLPFEYDLENIIDDWIMMGFLVGNDFIPHLPHLHIHHDALPMLWEKYKEVLPTLEGYLNEGGHLNLKRFETYVTVLAKFDKEHFNEQFVDMKYLEGKQSSGRARAGMARGEGRGSKKDQSGSTHKQTSSEGAGAVALMEDQIETDGGCDTDSATEQLSGDLLAACIDTSDDDFDTFEAEFSAHKRDYYMTKLEYESVTPQVLKEQASAYVQAIQWILLYYFEGVQSWNWYYPHHYAPYISDLHDFTDLQIHFDMSEPFKPFEQLMAVLPAASKEFLPEPLQAIPSWRMSSMRISPCSVDDLIRGFERMELMTSEDSPVVDYYPVKFKTDLNGKQQDWEAVVLIPFIDEERLLLAMHTRDHLLTPEEQQRNTHGPCYLYQYTPELQGLYPSPMPSSFPDVAASHAKVCHLPKFHFCLEPSQIKKGLLHNVLMDIYFPGFPTLKNIPHEAYLEKAGVKVFQQNSRGFSMMLRIRDLPEKRLEEVAEDLLGQSTYVGWPHLHEAKVHAVADEQFRIEIVEHHKKGGQSTVQWKRHELSSSDREIVYRQASSIKERYRDRFGVVVGKTTVLVFASTMTGRRYMHTSHGKITVEKQFSTCQQPYALQATCKDVLVHAPEDMHFHTLDELFPAGASVFMLGNPNYGSQGEVMETEMKEGRVRVSFTLYLEPDLSEVAYANQEGKYMPVHIAAQRTGLNPHLLSRITGTILIIRGDGGNPDSRANIGLNLKFSKRGEELPGYTRKTQDGWLYSDKAVQTVNGYLQEFPQLWDYIAQSQTGNSDVYTEAELFPPRSTKGLKDVLKYLEQLPCRSVQPMKSGGEILEEPAVQMIENIVDSLKEKQKQKKVKMLVKPHLLFRPLPNQGSLEPDPGTMFMLFDRVVVVKMGYSVPFGCRGTVTGIHKGEKESDVIYDVVFDEEFSGGLPLRCSKNRGYRVPGVAMLSLTYGEQRKYARVPLSSQQHPAPQAWQQKPGFISNHGNKQHQQQMYSALQQQQNQAKAGLHQRSGFNGYPSQSQPQFFMPKVTAQKPGLLGQSPHMRPGKFSVAQPILQKSSVEDSEFAKTWKVLEKATTSGEMRTSGSKASAPCESLSPCANVHTSLSKSGALNRVSNVSPNSDMSNVPPGMSNVSLQSAAEALGKIPLPTLDLLEENVLKTGTAGRAGTDPAVGMLVDVSDTTCLASSTVTADGLPVGVCAASAVDAGGSSAQQAQTPSVAALFQQAQKAPSSLPAAPWSFHKPSATQEPPAAVDQSAALKQMLKIGVSDAKKDGAMCSASDDNNRKSYGKQLSVQELFDGAKQASAQTVEAAAPSKPGHQEPSQPSHHAQHLQPLLPAPALLATPPSQNRARTPLMELASIMTAAGHPVPTYDFNYHPRQKGYIGYVSFPGGARFEGSLCQSKDEAAESAASMALLHLRSNLLTHMGQQWYTPQRVIRPTLAPRFFSPKSAFSPVPPVVHFGPGMFSKVPPPGFVQSPFASQLQPHSSKTAQRAILRPQQPSPAAVYNQSAQRPASHGQQPQHAAGGQAQTPPVSAAAPCRPSQLQPNLAARQTELDTAAGWGEGTREQQGQDPSARKVSSAKASSTEAFIPLQVTKKQRRKDDTVEKPESSNNCMAEGISRALPSSSAAPPHLTGEVLSSPSKTDDSAPDADVGRTAPPTPATPKIPGRQSARKHSAGGSEGKPTRVTEDRTVSGSGKKRRSRIAANFGSSK